MFAILMYSIAGGLLAVLATARVEQIAWKFLRLVGLLAVAALAIPMVAGLRDGGLTWVSGAALGTAVFASFLAVYAPIAERAPRGLRLVCASGGAAGLLAASLAAMEANASAGLTAALTTAAQTLSGLLLGSITLAWLLGHAYLTATRMTLAPLLHFSRMLSWTVGIRLGFLVVSFAVAWLTGDLPIAARLGDAWLIACLRIGVGLVGVAVFAYMVADCVRLRSTQSATGILYFGSVMAYVGELAGQQLTREIGWPL